MKLILVVLTMLFAGYQCIPAKLTSAEKLTQLREKMAQKGFSAYIIPSEDEHQSEYVANYDKRRKWISDFTGSAGIAVVTAKKAALWTDGRYFLQAENELDKTSWILMKSGLPGVPTVEQWLISELAKDAKVAQNAKLTSISDWQSRDSSLKAGGLSFVDTSEDLIDLIWTQDRPPKPKSQIKVHDIAFAGRTWAQKIDEVIKRMGSAGADLFAVTALDEVAWLFNMRGSDIPYNPMFFAYAIVSADKNHSLYIDPSRIDTTLSAHLAGIRIRPYESIFDDITAYSQANKKIWISPMSSFAILNAVKNTNVLINDRASPVRSIKAVKNEVEIEKTRGCQIRDSIARVRHMYWLENQMRNGSKVTEVSAAEALENFQKQDPLFRGLSFNSISAVGEHAAIIHYSTSEETNVDLEKNKIYLLDAGAQYEDCSTDITRTHHYGTPTQKEILAYTLVLQGVIDLAKLVFPPTYRGRDIDVVARSYLWKSGLDYGHGTGHGIGYYLSIHEFPPRTRYTFTDPYDEVFAIGMFQSDEPGYYEDGEFGIRLETDIEVVKADTPYNFRGQTYLTFYAQTLVPFEMNLIDVKLLERDQVNWLNTYNQRIREHVGEYFRKNNELDLYSYVLSKTEPIEYIE